MTRIETSRDRARVDHNELVAVVTAHIERTTGRKVDGSVHLSSGMGSASVKWGAFAHLKDEPAGLQLEHGAEYTHKEWGRVMFVASHPHDGALLIIERMETVDLDDDDLVLGTCERSDLAPAEGQQWPFLGFTSFERSRQQNRAFGEQHGFAEVPEGSGRWQYPDGSPVPSEVWDAAWRTTFLPKED